LGYEIPLPPLAEQRRVVARIEELAAQIHEARTLRQKAVEEAEALEKRMAHDVFPKPSEGVVSDWIRFQTGYAFKSEWFTETGIRLARNANIGHGTLDWGETVRLPESRRAQFQPFELNVGDILITLDRPIISTGVKVARVRKEDLPCLLLQRVARARFQSDAVVPEYFFRWLRSPHFTNALDPGRSNGVPHISHKDIEKIPFAVPDGAEQRRIVAELDALQAEVDALKRLQAETAAELDALLPAILDKAFKGEL
jgi:type I restriction enzyme S subunit